MNKDTKFLLWCINGAKIFSTCSKAQYMAIVVGTDGRVLGTGYNGAPPNVKHCIDGGCPRAINNVPSGTPYDYGDGLCVATHAEPNALMHSDRSARMGGTLYVNGVPCFGCSKLIASSGLSRVVYLDNAQSRSDVSQSIMMMEASGIKTLPIALDNDFDASTLLTLKAS